MPDLPPATLTLPEPEDIKVTEAHTAGEEGQSPAEARESFMTEAEFERGIASQMQHQYDRMSKALSNFSDRWKTGASPTSTDYRKLQTSLMDDKRASQLLPPKQSGGHWSQPIYTRSSLP